MNFAFAFHSVSKIYRVPHRSRFFLQSLFHNIQPEFRTVIDALDFKIECGEKVLVTGKNGVGKTTLLKLTAGYCEPTKGSVVVGSKSIGVMFSHQLLYPNLTGYQNLEFSARLYGMSRVKERIDELGAEWGLSNFIDSLVGSYSNGQRTLLALARANVHRPSILLLDEPTMFLDSLGKEIALRFLSTSQQTILVTSQEPFPFENLCARVIQL